jgi:PadR family transcriptional regulator, regulatory protein PadR
MTANAPLGVFEEQVMVAVVRTAPEAYGMSIRRELERVTLRDVAIGAVYATLDRVEAKGLVRSERGSVQGASRRLFEITREGARALAESRAMHDRLWSGVDVHALLAHPG